jgi:hypothetical protein
LIWLAAIEAQSGIPLQQFASPLKVPESFARIEFLFVLHNHQAMDAGRAQSLQRLLVSIPQRIRRIQEDVIWLDLLALELGDGLRALLLHDLETLRDLEGLQILPNLFGGGPGALYEIDHSRAAA